MRKFVLLSLISLIPLAQSVPPVWAAGHNDAAVAGAVNNTKSLSEPTNNAAYSGVAPAAQPGLSATPEVFYAEGMRNFRAANYAYAENYFRKAAKLRPNDAMIRYYLATCLVYQHRHPEAIAQYRMSYKLDPYGVVSGFCRRALLAYRVPVDGTTDPRKIVGKPSVTRKVDEGQLEKVISQGELQMQAAVTTIRRQAEDEKSRKKSFAKDLSESAIKAGANKARSIKEEAEDQIRAIYEAEQARQRVLSRGRSIYSRYDDSELVKQQAEQIRREADAKAQLEQELAQERSRKHQEWSENRQKEMDSVADNLQNQLQTAPAQRSVSINPVGTGLYVRNYTPPREKGPEARNSVVRFVDKLGQDDSYPAERGGETQVDSQDTESKEVSEQVTGRVVEGKTGDKRVNEKINQSFSGDRGSR